MKTLVRSNKTFLPEVTEFTCTSGPNNLEVTEVSFLRQNIKSIYRSSEDNLALDFFVPLLSNAVQYKRAVGFFSSSALIQVSRGLSGLVKNGGRVLLVASPRLQEEDIEAIHLGYMEREKAIEQALLRSIDEPKSLFEEQRLNLLAHLIADCRMDIKIAFMESGGKLGIYHEKIGLIYDKDGNVVAFTGSLNESSNALMRNFESIDVFRSWAGAGESERVMQKEFDFDELWEDRTHLVRVLEFPDVARERLESYKRDHVDYDIDCKEYGLSKEADVLISRPKYPRRPKDIQLYDYQEDAVSKWEAAGFKGVFNMATGTGKTITGLAAVTRLSEKLGHKLAIIIVCPLQHLVEQWAEDVCAFGMDPIIGYSSSRQANWRQMLANSITDYNLGVIDHFCFLTTNASFALDFVQGQIDRIRRDVVLVVDEAHNFGSDNLGSKLPQKIQYRLALSATFERHGDPEGTQVLCDYFGNECISYLLGRAIREHRLTPYYYHPVVTWLTDDELCEYRRLSASLAKLSFNDHGVVKLTEMGKKIAIRRSRLVAGAINKLHALEREIEPYKSASHILVYCGATKVIDPDYVEGRPDGTELRQVSAVSDLLGNKLGMKVSQFTSAESAQERAILKREFAEGEALQALVAIRCLDEGVNIPRIETAFILASSTNPKEYIQRRGRVLRLAPGKTHAAIYDFVTIPRPIEQARNASKSEAQHDVSLVKKEITRMLDFADLSLNPQDGLELVDRLRDAYDLDKYRGGEDDGGRG